MVRLAKGGDRPYIRFCVVVAMPAIAMFWLLLAAADSASAAPTARFTASPVQGATCVAPCVVHVDATATTSTEHSRAFHELDYAWDCGEANAGSWTNRTGGDKNRPRGAVTGCVYATPGTKTIRLTVREPDGETSTAQTNVTVADPNAQFSGTSTVCVSASGNFTDCPAGAARITSSDYDAALMDSDKCNVDGGKRRCLLRCGETFTQSSTVSFAGGTSPGLVSCYGGTTGRANVSSTVQMGTVNQGWTISKLNWSNSSTGVSGFDVHPTVGNITLYDNAITTRSRGNVTTQLYGNAHPDLVAIVGSTHTVIPVTGLAGYSQHFLRGRRYLILGNVFDENGEGEFNIRTALFDRSAIQHNELLDPQDDIAAGIARNPLNLRGMSTPSGTGLPVVPTQYLLVSDNLTESTIGTGTNVGAIWRVCQENGCNSSPGYGVDMTDILFERNMSRATGNAANGVSGLFYLQGGRITVRNNVIDMQGAVTSGTAAHTLVYQYPNQSQCPSCVDDEIVVQGNTVYWDEPSTRGLSFCNSPVGTGHVCQLNLAYRPNDTTARPEATGNWTTGGNMTATVNPFTAVPRAQGQTVAADFALATTSVARNRLGTLASRTGLPKDFGQRCRVPATTGAFDAGAWEYGATDCTGTAPPAVCGNGTREGAEQCDDGNTTAGDGCSATCTLEVCGNGVREGTEQCDDGNTTAGDGCSATCRVEVCGNGVREGAELCDDGNTTAGDGCSATCRSEICGNRTIDPGETCDDGNTTAGDGCSATCRIEVCGNGLREGTELCDDGNTTSGDGCSATCRTEICGNGTRDPQEQCDDGNGIGGDGCSAICRIEVCGNGIREGAELCDDGNTTAGDGCSATCRTEICGNRTIDPGETCDDGNTAGGDGCSAICRVEVCGNGVREGAELCDDGNTVAGDGCSATCRTEICGNGVRDAQEQCDDGNTAGGDGCSATCRSEGCGNGIREGSETCDDGNLAGGDGCSATCRVEACGNGTLDAGEQCDDANATAGDGCRADCTAERCGDSILDLGETCDDGNVVGGDGCRTSCTIERCGDGILDGVEACDDGNATAGDGCSPTCTRETAALVSYRVNVGGTAYVDSRGQSWVGDAGFVNGGTLWNSIADVAGTTDDPLYRTRRSGPVGTQPLTLRFPVNGTGPYRVRLHFTELQSTVTRTGQRVFDIEVEDAFTFRRIDILAAVPWGSAWVKTFFVNVDDGELKIEFLPRAGQPIVSAVEVIEELPGSIPPRLISTCSGGGNNCR